MPSTYTTNNGIELIATGEQSGTWGGTTNTNLELLDTALDGQVSVTLGATGSSGSPNTLPVTDGAASNGRNRLVIFADGGDLGGTAFVQLTPNNAEKIVYVRNNLSGSRSILLFQGTYSASNDYEIPAGKTAVVFFDGAGSGAVAANVFNNAHFDAINVVGNVVVGGTVTGTGTSVFASLDISGDIDVDGTTNLDVVDIDGAVDMATTLTLAGNADFNGDLDVDGTTNLDVVDIDGAVDMATTLTLAGNADFNGDLDVDGTTNLDAVDIDGAVQIDNTVTVGVDDTGYDVKFFGASASHFLLWDQSADELVLAVDSKLSFNDAAGGENIVASANGHLEINSGTTLDVTAPTVQINSSSLFDVNGNIDVSGTYTGGGLMTTGGNIVIPNAGNIGSASDTDAIAIASDGQVTLTQTLTGTAVNFSGVATATTFEPDGDTAAGDNAAIGYTAAEGLILTGQGSTSDLTFKNDADATVFSIPTGTDDVLFPDDAKIMLGDGSDLQIYHDGSNSYVDDTGTGALILRGNSNVTIGKYTGETMGYFEADGAVSLYHDNAIKLATTSTGISVTGDVIASGKIGLDTTDYITFTDNTQMDVYINNSNEFRFEADGDFHADGNVIAYSSTISDERLKEDIKPITGALDKVGQLSGYTFTYKADGKQSAGVIAQEVEAVLPSAVTESTLPLKTDDGVEYKTVQYDQLHGLLIEAIKELKAEIEELKNGSTK